MASPIFPVNELKKLIRVLDKDIPLESLEGLSPEMANLLYAMKQLRKRLRFAIRLEGPLPLYYDYHQETFVPALADSSLYEDRRQTIEAMWHLLNAMPDRPLSLEIVSHDPMSKQSTSQYAIPYSELV